MCVCVKDRERVRVTVVETPYLNKTDLLHSLVEMHKNLKKSNNFFFYFLSLNFFIGELVAKEQERNLQRKT
jgi:hypothetical protein